MLKIIWTVEKRILVFIKINALKKTNAHVLWSTRQFVENSIVIWGSSDALQMSISGKVNIGNQ